jgi:acyl-CoA thioesterase-1
VIRGQSIAVVAVLAGLSVACASLRDGIRATRAPGVPANVPGDPGAAPSVAPTSRDLRYVALGDSYTVGTATRSEVERWPDQLVARLGSWQPRLELVANLGVNGFTSRDVIDVELPQLEALRPEFASLLVGVNDVVQGVPEPTYRANIEAILDDLTSRLPSGRIVVVATPDFTVTPRGAAFGDPADQSARIRRNNDILRELATARGIAYVDIYDLSLRARDDRSLVADDGLHPSRAQYALWVERIAPIVERLIGR